MVVLRKNEFLNYATVFEKSTLKHCELFLAWFVARFVILKCFGFLGFINLFWVDWCRKFTGRDCRDQPYDYLKEEGKSLFSFCLEWPIAAFQLYQQSKTNIRGQMCEMGPELGSHARLVNLLLSSQQSVFVFRSGKSTVLSTMHCKWRRKLDAEWPRFVGCYPSAVCCTEIFCWFRFYLREIHFLDKHRNPDIEQDAEGKVCWEQSESFVRRSGIWTCDAFAANNQEVTNPVKRSMRYDYCENQCLWGSETLPTEG